MNGISSSYFGARFGTKKAQKGFKKSPNLRKQCKTITQNMVKKYKFGKVKLSTAKRKIHEQI